ncbi:hypothetical protein GGF46_005252 [Coemansia sp. RSA 552]|nr:hypothetical protein GGF46_005252 [Coemansia sp. RSA 552]
MTTPGLLPYTASPVGLTPDRKMPSSRPSDSPKPTPAIDTGGISSRSAGHSPTTRAASESATVQGLDALYDRLSSASQSLKSLSPTLPAEGSVQPAPHTAPATTRAESPARAPAVDSGASSPTGSGGCGATNRKARDPGQCDPECACQRVLLSASPGACGLCGGRPATLAQLNDDRTRAQGDLEIATQRINELAHEKARHVDYIADLETRASEQARKIDQQRDVIAGLKNDLSAMNDKFVDQVNMTAEIAHSRELVEAELEDLTQKLFTEANTMVSVEKKARADAEKTSNHLRNVIADLETRLSSETMQSQELKGRIEKMSAEYDDLVLRRTIVSSRRGSVGSHMSDMAVPGADNASARREGSVVSGIVGPGAHADSFRLNMHAAAVIGGTKAHPSSPGAGSPIRLDEQLLAEFKEFAVEAQTQRQNNPMNMTYMKSVVSADVEPCLRFGPSPRISSRNVLDAIAGNRIQIEEMTPQIAAEMRRQQQTADRPNASRHAMLWERLSGSVASNPYGCQACGRECQQCTYRFRMGYRPESEWIQVDTICRDRLVAACEFYGFVRYLRQGIFASRSIMELYMETIRLRLSMFYARIGAYGFAIDLDPTLAEAPQFLRNPGSGGGSTPHQLESPTTLGHVLPPNVPYLSSSRAASAVNVAVCQDTVRTSSSLAVDAREAMSRLRSRSQETSTLPSSASAITVPAPVATHMKEEHGGAAEQSATEEPSTKPPADSAPAHLSDPAPVDSTPADAATPDSPKPAAGSAPVAADKDQAAGSRPPTP